MGLNVSQEGQTDSHVASLAKVTVWRARQNEIKSGQLESRRQTKPGGFWPYWGWGLEKVPKQQGFPA